MNRKIISVLALCLVAVLSFCAVAFAEETVSGMPKGEDVYIKSASYNDEAREFNITIANKAGYDIEECAIMLTPADENEDGIAFEPVQSQIHYSTVMENSAQIVIVDFKAGSEKKVVFSGIVNDYAKTKKVPQIDASIRYLGDVSTMALNQELTIYENNMTDIFNEKASSKADAIVDFLKQTGFSMTTWQQLVMILIACVLLYLAIVKKFEPLLLLPIAFGMLLTNLAGAELFHEELFAEGHVHWNLFAASNAITPGLVDILYLGVKLGIYPCLIFVGVGAMTDFGPLIANPKSLLLGAAAQVGIFATFIGARLLGFTPAEAGSIGIIGGADGPTAIFVTSKLAPHLLGPIAVAAYSYMALVPVIQPPIMKLLTTKKERQIEMKALREVSRTEKIIFPIVVTIFVALLVPSAGALVGSLMLGNLLKECGVCERLSKTVQNELMNIVTVFLGVSVGATATASTFLSLETIKIIVMGVVAFAVATAGGVLLAKFMNLFLKNKINPLIGSAGVSAVPMAARVSQKVGQSENPSNFLLMHAMGPNVAGVIGSAIAAGTLIAMLG